ncbi:choline sulfatase [gut metagenome]|uniref:Choline sulfatase n=1 Tax=gut metagenome TaxID=749906 RepID=J9F4A9_9ZZZZ
MSDMMMKSFSLSQLACLSVCCTSTLMAAERPNIIYIFTDQHTASAMSCAGNPDVYTPNLDRLAAAGILFQNAYCTAPLSGPSRGAMFTGHYPDAVGLSVNGAPMPDSLQTQTLGTLMKNAGYECVYGGKWHLPLLDIPDKEFGFDRLYKHSDDGLAEACVAFLSQKHEQPFFLVASYDNPHNICEYARQQNLPYGPIAVPDIRECPGLPVNFAKNPYDAGVIDSEKRANYNVYPSIDYTVDDWRMYRYTYYRLVEKVDQEIGKIIDAIDQNDLWKNTVVIFSSDHGDGIGAHHWNQKSALYEEVMNVPLIVTLPEKKHAGTVLPQLINGGLDFFVSVCDWGKAKKPAGVCGKSFRALVEKADPQVLHQDYIILETRFDGSKTRGWVVRSQRYKYVLYDKGRCREQLFDMVADRGEMRNLAMEKNFDEILQQHRDKLAEWFRKYKIRPTRPRINDVPGESLVVKMQ